MLRTRHRALAAPPDGQRVTRWTETESRDGVSLRLARHGQPAGGHAHPLAGPADAVRGRVRRLLALAGARHLLPAADDPVLRGLVVAGRDRRLGLVLARPGLLPRRR